MAINDWVNDLKKRINRDGLNGIMPALVELWYGIRDKFRSLHWLTPDSRTLVVGEVEIEIQQRYIGEFDQIRAHHNESWLVDDLNERVRAEDIFWDVGGNIGIYTLLTANKGAEVVTFEPWLENAATIERNLRRNELKARVVPKALFDENSPREFTLDERETPGSGRGSLLDGWQNGESRTVECVRGDTEVSRNCLPRPTVVKIDVEGAELEVLKGLGDLLDDVRMVYCELHGVNDQAVRDLLQANGFEIEADLEDTRCGIVRARS